MLHTYLYINKTNFSDMKLMFRPKMKNHKFDMDLTDKKFWNGGRQLFLFYFILFYFIWFYIIFIIRSIF